jgi:hypothetical protein
MIWAAIGLCLGLALIALALSGYLLSVHLHYACN